MLHSLLSRVDTLCYSHFMFVQANLRAMPQPLVCLSQLNTMRHAPPAPDIPYYMLSHVW